MCFGTFSIKEKKNSHIDMLFSFGVLYICCEFVFFYALHSTTRY